MRGFQLSVRAGNPHGLPARMVLWVYGDIALRISTGR